MDEDLNNMRNLSKMYREMIDDVLRLRHINFSMLKLPHFDYADQTKKSNERVDLATSCAIHYGLHTGMVIQYLKGEYVGESRDANSILESVPPHITKKDCDHIERIINQGCPTYLNFEEEHENKYLALRKGNQHTFDQHHEVTAKTMNKEEKIVTSSLSNFGPSISPRIVEQPPKEYVRRMENSE